MQNTFDSEAWLAHHTKIASKQAEFSKLPKAEKEKAYQAARQKVGNRTICIDELMAAHSELLVQDVVVIGDHFLVPSKNCDGAHLARCKND